MKDTMVRLILQTWVYGLRRRKWCNDSQTEWNRRKSPETDLYPCGHPVHDKRALPLSGEGHFLSVVLDQCAFHIKRERERETFPPTSDHTQSSVLGELYKLKCKVKHKSTKKKQGSRHDVQELSSWPCCRKKLFNQGTKSQNPHSRG